MPTSLLNQNAFGVVASSAPGTIELTAMDGERSSAGSSGRPRRRSGLYNEPGTSLTATATATATGTSRLRPLDDPDGIDSWDDAWDDGSDTNSKGEDEDAIDRGGRLGRTGDGDRLLLEDDYEGGDLQADEETGLGATARRLRDEDRRQRMQLDQRIVASRDYSRADVIGGARRSADVADDPETRVIMAALTVAERKEADQHVVRRLVINGTLIGLWYLFSLSLSLYNKWMFGSSFPFPLFTTSVHMLVQFLLACLVLYFVPSLRPGGSGRGRGSQGGSNSSSSDDDVVVIHTPGDDEDDDEGADKADHHDDDNARMTRWFYLTRIGPCGAATGLDIGLGNASLKLITLTFYTMCKSSSLAFVLLFAFLFRLEAPTLRLVAIIAAMTAGVVMMVAGEVEFDTFGFVLVISAAFFSGFRWGLTQIMLLRNPATSNPFSSIFYLAPVMFVTLFALALPMEGIGALASGLDALHDRYGALRASLLVLFPGSIAFLMTASEFALLQRTSVVTLSIAGIFKEVVTIITATVVFHDTLTLINLLGLVITLAAIIVYNYIKITRMRQQAQIDVHTGHERQRQQRRRRHHPHSYSSSVSPASTVSRRPSGDYVDAGGAVSGIDRPKPQQQQHSGHGTEDDDAEDAGLLHRHGD